MIKNNQAIYYYKIDDHYNAEGNELVATVIYNILIKEYNIK
tara:strand:- start:77 stop:199 length:123 start_codon:yes stop_codon:yes gene_type:complete